MCVRPLGLLPPLNIVIDLLFNAQTDSSLTVPGYLLSPPNPLKRRKRTEMSWTENFICSVNVESGSFLSNETVDGWDVTTVLSTSGSSQFGG